MRILKTLAILLLIIVVFGGVMFGVNFYTGPLIEANSAGAANERLDAVMPEGDKAYEDITATLTMPEKFVSAANDKRTAEIVAVHKETKNGFGYVVEVAWTSEDSHGSEPNLVLVGISTDGKIIKVNNEVYHDTEAYNIFNKDPDYTSTFENQDSTLVDVGTVSGSTHSSEAFRSAVAHAFEVLVSNDMIAAGLKSDDQILEELIPTVTVGYGKLAEMTVSGNIVKGMKAENDAGFVYIMTEGKESFLAVVNAVGVCKIYNTEATDVTADHAALVTEAKAASAAQVSYADALAAKINTMMPGATDLTAVELDTFNTVVSAVSFTVDGDDYYGFYSRSIGFHQMDVYIVLDANGAIAKVDAKQLIFEEEYFMTFAGMPDNYKGGFVGFTSDTWTGDAAVIATATYTSDAMNQSVEDAFEAFNSIKGGEQ